MGNEHVGGGEPDRGGGADAAHPYQAHAGEEEQRAPDQRDQHGLSEIGLQHEPGHRHAEQPEREGVGGHFRPARGFAEQPRDQDDESGLEKFRRLNVDPGEHDPAPRALDLGAEMQRGGDQQQAHHKHDEGKPANVPWRQERGGEQHRQRRDQIEHVPADEIERLEPEPGRHRRACGE